MDDPDQTEVRLDFDRIRKRCHVSNDRVYGLFFPSHIEQPPTTIGPNEAVIGATQTPAYDRIFMIAAYRLDVIPTHYVEDSRRFEPSVYQVADGKDPVS
ncbi:hypothetical protein R69658_05662 [Paraburkholderia aspalathi]|uniref:Uncharacterized protein n=1 Tax=Paraburkholderia aspalathi TaxID=1324617 RepID=A0A1I7DU73_9BURK|nr:hypothetical protein R20943_01823 [Paraburkholderia aspalathi]CAE6757894.1 hypothetical protein R69746_03257 [Paraburkholderia aspalathi]CAE6816796.1 hypothetical protein R69658_05662 [Paraburkholderia aspalathi]SFU15230.1 hypothetical protein SAMN05192563_1011217 [Paraburkholderia aspalathi]